MLINELIQGMEQAKQLKVQLGTKSTAQTRQVLVQNILSSYEKALSILKWGGSITHPQTVEPESPLSVNGSPGSDYFDVSLKDSQDTKGYSKKRKMLPKWTEHMRVSTETGFEGPVDDGYSWRKYGQKDILGAKYPRSYYRCTYRNTQNCWATKQVQRSDKDPTIFEVTYRGVHACSHGTQLVQPPASPDKDEHKLHNHNHQQKESQEILLNLRQDLTIKTEGLNKNDMPPSFSFPSTSFSCRNRENHNFSPPTFENNIVSCYFSPSFISPATPESNYRSALPFQMNNLGRLHDVCSESDFTGLISANTSASNSPILDVDFSLDPIELDPEFPFNTPEFFP